MTPGLVLAAAIAAAPAPQAPAAAKAEMTHRVIAAGVDVALSPASRQLNGRAKLRLKPRDMRSMAPGTAVLELDPVFKIARVTLDDRPAKFQVDGPRLVVPLPKVSRPGNGWVVGVEYAGRLAADHPLHLGPDGACLPSGTASWYPVPPGETPRVPTIVTVHVPKAWRVTGPATRSTVDTAHQAVRLDFSNGEPGFVAGPFKVFSAAGHTFYALGSPPTDAAPAKAVEALYKARGLQLATPGRAPGAQATVVELPAGWTTFAGKDWTAGPRPPGGLGAWLGTLAWRQGEQVDRHAAWLVESLAAYAEEVAQGDASRPARAAAMQAHLAAYQAFRKRHPDQDRALDAVTSADPAWEPVIGDKGVVLWNLVRETVGDEAFWGLLRRYQASLRQNRGGWPGFQAAAGPKLGWLDQWLATPGLPTTRLAGVKVAEHEGRWQVSGELVQEGPFFRFPIDLAVVTEAGAEKVAFTTFAPNVPFHFVVNARPLRLVLDGQDRAPVVRRPHLAIPEGVGPADAVIVYGTNGDEAANQATKAAAEALAERFKRYKALDLPVRADKDLTAGERRRTLILMGRPGVNAVVAELADQFPVRFARREATDAEGEAVVDGKALWWQGRTFAQPDQGVVQVIANPLAPEKVVLLFAGLSPRAQADALRFTQRPATFCIFANDQVIEEGDALRPFPDLDVVLY